MGAFASIVRGALAGLNERAGNTQVASDLEAANQRARDERTAKLRAQVVPHALALKGLQEKLRAATDPNERAAITHDIARNLSEVRGILYPEENPQGNFFERGITDKLHLTSLRNRQKEAAAKQAKGQAQDQSEAQAIETGNLPYTETAGYKQTQAQEAQKQKDALALVEARAKNTPDYKNIRGPNGETATIDVKSESIPPGWTLAGTGGAPKLTQVTGADGKPQFASEIGGKFYDQSGALISDAKPYLKPSAPHPQSGISDGKNVFGMLTPNGWVDAGTRQPLHDFRPAPTYAQTGLYRIEPMQNQDGSIGSALLNGRTGKFAPITGQGSTPIAPSVLSEVEKNAQPAIEADTRFRVMKDSEPLALADPPDQQAEINILTNHIGMTLGLQKGARINQAVWNEAIASAPWLQTIGAKFSDDGYLSGVTLTPTQIKQMVALAQERRKRQWQQAQDAAGLYGVNLPIPDDLDNPSSTLEGPKTKALKTARQNQQNAAPVVQFSPSTKQYRYSTDGGRTWQSGKPPQQ